MILELIGCSGAGKTKLSRAFRRHADERVRLVRDLAMDRSGRRWVRHPKTVNLALDATVLPSFLRAAPANRDFLEFAFDRLRRHAPSAFSRLNYRREIVRNVGLYELARHLDIEATLVLDEGPALTAYHLFVYTLAPFSQRDLETFARLVPMPDGIVYVRVPPELLLERALRRPDRRRELVSADRDRVRRRIVRAVEVFEALAALPRIRGRLLVVENPDGSPAEAVARIAAFAAARGPAPVAGPTPATAPGRWGAWG